MPNREHWNAKRSATTSRYFVYHVTFKSRDIPSSFRHLRPFPRTLREIWVWTREARNQLLALDLQAKAVKNEARKCSRCSRAVSGVKPGAIERSIRQYDNSFADKLLRVKKIPSDSPLNRRPDWLGS